MKTNLLLLFLLGWTGIVFGQESFKRVYMIPASLKGRPLMQDITVKYENLQKYGEWGKIKIDSLKNLYPEETLIKISEQIKNGDQIQTIFREDKIDKDFYKRFTFKKSIRVDSIFSGYVKFDEGKIIVNGDLPNCKCEGKRNNHLYYFTLRNRDRVSLRFFEFTVSLFTVPFKYRFKQPGVPEEFSTASVNLNGFLGISIGKTSFFYRDKVESITNNSKFTFGLFVGSSMVDLNKSNTSAAEKPLADDVKITKGLATVGLGLAYSFNKISAGGFIGWDYAVGNDSEKWNYNKKPWIGIALGYSLFNF